MALSDEELSSFLANIKSIAAVGVADSPGTPARDVFSYQQSQGYRIIPVSQKSSTVLGNHSVAKLADIQGPVDLVNVFETGPILTEAVNTAIEKGVKGVWFQPGVTDETAEKRIQAAGIPLVTGKCFKREHRRLLGDKAL